MKNLILIVVVVICFLGCCKQVSNTYPVLNLENIGSVLVDNKLSDIADSVHYIALETSDSCLLEGNCSIAGITDQYIYINSREVYQFSLEGKFIRRIGKLGRGPGEYSKISTISLYGDEIYVVTWSGEALVYNNQGVFLRKIDAPKGMSSACKAIVNDSIYIAEETKYDEKGAMELYLAIYKNGILSEKTFVQGDDLNNKRSFINHGRFYSLNDNIYYMNYYNDTIYRIDENYRPRPDKIFTFGKYTPTRKMLESLEDRRNAEKAGYIFYQLIEDSDRYNFIWVYVKGIQVLCVYDKQQKKIIYEKPCEGYLLRENKGLEDDLTNIGTSFWPLYVSADGTKAATLTNAIFYDEKVCDALGKRGIIINEESNPVLSICYLKN